MEPPFLATEPRKLLLRLTLECFRRNSFENRSTGLVELVVCLKNDRKWAWLLKICARFVRNSISESPFWKSWIRHWKWSPDGSHHMKACEQLVLPKQCRTAALLLAHNVPAAGHLGVNKTRTQILYRFYWPGVFKRGGGV